MTKILDANQVQKIDRPYLQPIYLANIFLDGETLYFSDRCYRYNGHDYEDYLSGPPQIRQSINALGGYLNLSGKILFRNQPFRSYPSLLDFFDVNPIVRREMELYVLYIESGETFGSDVSTKLHRLTIGEFSGINRISFEADLSSIMQALNDRAVFKQINRITWPNAAPNAIGKYENLIYGSLRDVPCPWVLTGANSTLFLDLAAAGETYVTLSEVDWPVAFPSSGTIQVDGEKISYSAKDSVNKRLTISARGSGGTAAASHKRGATVIEALASYKCLVMGHVGKAIGNVKCEGVRIAPAGYTANLNDAGKGTIVFTAAQMESLPVASSSSTVSPGSHSHDVVSSIVLNGSSASFTADIPPWSDSGIPDNMRDGNTTTYKGAGISNGHSGLTALFQVNFTQMGGVVGQVKACIAHNLVIGDGSARIDYLTDTWHAGPSLSTLNGTQKFVLSGVTSQPTGLRVYVTAGATSCSEWIYEFWLEVDYTATDPTALGASTTTSLIQRVLALPLITCDADGFPDDGLGTYTGTPNALIENPSDVRRHLLIAIYGRLAAEIGASFDTARTGYAGRIAGGYKFAMILSRLGSRAADIFKALDEQSRSQLKEDGGKFELLFHDDAAPVPVMTIDSKIWAEEPVFAMRPISEIKNRIRVRYDFDWSGAEKNKKYGDYRRQAERTDASSIASYGDLPEDIDFEAVRLQAMAEDVADWILQQKKEIQRIVDLTVMWPARPLERGDWFTINHILWSGRKWRILDFAELPGAKGQGVPKFAISADTYETTVLRSFSACLEFNAGVLQDRSIPFDYPGVATKDAQVPFDHVSPISKDRTMPIEYVGVAPRLLLESGDFILLESGDKIQMED